MSAPDAAHAIATHLKKSRPSRIPELREALGLSENAVRHHLNALELLDALLHAARAEGLEEKLLERVAADIVSQVEPHLQGLEGQERLLKLLQLLAYGDLLPEIEAVRAGVCLHAHNCVYVDAGRHYEAVCNLLPRVVTAATGLNSFRPRCQLHGARSCEFVVETSA